MDNLILYNLWLYHYCIYRPVEYIRTVYTIYTGCNRRNVRDFGRVFLQSNYTDITQNTYIQSWTVTEIMAIKMCGLLGCRRTVVSNIILVNCACPTRHVYAMTLASALQWVGELWSANMPFVFSHVEYCDMHFMYGFCDGNANAAVEEYRRRYPERRILLYTAVSSR